MESQYGFELEHDKSVTVWSFSFIFTLFISILFMNLLIAIISATYDRVNEFREKSSYV